MFINNNKLTRDHSQGAALVAAAIRDSSATIREQIKGVVLFGYTKKSRTTG